MIVGPSGAGKSTIFHLLVRFWEYDFVDANGDGVCDNAGTGQGRGSQGRGRGRP